MWRKKISEAVLNFRSAFNEEKGKFIIYNDSKIHELREDYLALFKAGSREVYILAYEHSPQN